MASGTECLPTNHLAYQCPLPDCRGGSDRFDGIALLDHGFGSFEPLSRVVVHGAERLAGGNLVAELFVNNDADRRIDRVFFFLPTTTRRTPAVPIFSHIISVTAPELTLPTSD